jgi:hypothetical protein
VQKHILERYPKADLRVFVAWIPALPGDANPGVAKLLVDDRARHYWDGGRRLGRTIALALGYGGGVAWDVFLVYRAGAKWRDGSDAVGSPVISESGALARALRFDLQRG